MSASDKRWLSSGGTVTDAIYDAIKEQPDHHHCKQILENGIDNAIDCHEATPEFVMKWIKNEANNHHEGAAYTLQESLEDVHAADAHWDTYRIKHSIKVETCPPKGPNSYARLREKTMMGDSPQWGTPCEMMAALKCRRKLEGCGAFEEFLCCSTTASMCLSSSSAT